MQNFFVRGPCFCPCEVKTSIFFINNFHFSFANVNVVGVLLKVHCLTNNEKWRNQSQKNKKMVEKPLWLDSNTDYIGGIET